MQELIDFAKRFLKAANDKYTVIHPLNNISRIVNVEFFEKTNIPGRFRNIVISEQGEVDRSPCGTGTSAALAAMLGNGTLKPGDELINTNFIGSTFLAAAAGKTSIGLFSGVIPRITGHAYITGKSQFYLSDSDPFNYGFILNSR